MTAGSAKLDVVYAHRRLVVGRIIMAGADLAFWPRLYRFHDGH